MCWTYTQLIRQASVGSQSEFGFVLIVTTSSDKTTSKTILMTIHMLSNFFVFVTDTVRRNLQLTPVILYVRLLTDYYSKVPMC